MMIEIYDDNNNENEQDAGTASNFLGFYPTGKKSSNGALMPGGVIPVPKEQSTLLVSDDPHDHDSSPRSTANIEAAVTATRPMYNNIHAVRKKIKWAPLDEQEPTADAEEEEEGGGGNINKSKKRRVCFADSCLVYRTFTRTEYDRSPCGFSPEILKALVKLKERKEKRKRELIQERLLAAARESDDAKLKQKQEQEQRREEEQHQHVVEPAAGAEEGKLTNEDDGDGDGRRSSMKRQRIIDDGQ